MTENPDIEGADAAPVEPIPELTQEPEQADEPELAQQSPKKKRSVTTPNLYAAAALVAIIGGTAAGYAVQATRPATPLPPLSVTQPLYPVGPVFSGVQAGTLPASQDDATIVAGDLTKLLLATPKGASIPSWGYDHSWVVLVDNADIYDNPGSQFENEALNIERIADTAWTKGGVSVEIRISQYLPGSSTQAYTNYQNDTTDDTSFPIPAGVTAEGDQFKGDDGDTDYIAALHGNCIVEFWLTGTHSYPSQAMADSVVSEQMARL